MNAAAHVAKTAPAEPPKPEAEKPRARKLRAVLDENKSVPLKSMTLDQSKPSVVPGALTSTIVSNHRRGGIEYQLLYVPALRAVQVEHRQRNGDAWEVMYIPEHLVVGWIPEEVLP
jgi:hypothetical protein